MRYRVVLGFLLLAVAASLAGCGGGGGGTAAGDTTATEATTDTTEEPADGGAPAGTDTTLCQEITSPSSELNIAATNGDFTAVAKRWKELQVEFPDDLHPAIATVIEGYGKVAADPNQYSLLGTSPYKEAIDAIHVYTGANCA